jgi:hypothetical protein
MASKTISVPAVPIVPNVKTVTALNDPKAGNASRTVGTGGTFERLELP